MPAIIVENPQKILIVGSIDNNFNRISELNKISEQYDKIIINGGLSILSDIQIIEKLPPNIIYISGRTELSLLSKITDDNIIKWILKCPNIAIIKFSTRNLIITNGGIPLSINSLDELNNNLEVSFVSKINNQPWHKYYNGRFGYVISNNPELSTSPEYYSYSMKIGTSKEYLGKFYCQEVDEIGLKQTILI